MQSITIPKEKFDQMRREIKALRKGKLYARLLEFEQNVQKGRKYTRKELGF